MSELLEKILSKENMNTAYKRVCANNGAGGVDGMTVEELGDYIKKNWDSIRNQIRSRKYKPQPVRRLEIPKPNGGVRKLGIPTVMDRVIQQGIVQVISPMCEPLFSEWSYGFRPNRSCEMAVRQLLVYLNEGCEWIVDIDLEKFFDNVPQDNKDSKTKNMVSCRPHQESVETSSTRPRLKELTCRGKGLGQSLGFGFYKDSKTKKWKCRPHQESVKKFKGRLKELTCRKRPGTVTSKIEKINQVTRGWINYYALGSMKTAMAEIDAHLRTRLRVIIWKQWKEPSKRQWGLQKLGIGKDLARLTAYCGDRYYWVVTKTCVGRAISKEVLARAGLVSCLDYYNERHALKLC